jgi:hypothetical protein
MMLAAVSRRYGAPNVVTVADATALCFLHDQAGLRAGRRSWSTGRPGRSVRPLPPDARPRGVYLTTAPSPAIIAGHKKGSIVVTMS